MCRGLCSLLVALLITSFPSMKQGFKYDHNKHKVSHEGHYYYWHGIINDHCLKKNCTLECDV